MKRVVGSAVFLLFMVTLSVAQQNSMRPVSDLIDADDSNWKLISQWKDSATNKIEILSSSPLIADSALYRMQLNTTSLLGSVIHECGGMLIDNGWIRILGSGCNQFSRSLPDWNKGKTFNGFGDSPSFLLVADDVMGGFFAINAGGIDKFDIGKVFYFGPNNLRWKTTGLGYSEFIAFCFYGDIEKFYQGFRWKGWKEDVKNLNPDQVFSCYPLLWTDAGKNLQKNRIVVSVQKQWDLYQHKKPSGKKDTKKSLAYLKRK